MDSKHKLDMEPVFNQGQTITKHLLMGDKQVNRVEFSIEFQKQLSQQVYNIIKSITAHCIKITNHSTSSQVA